MSESEKMASKSMTSKGTKYGYYVIFALALGLAVWGSLQILESFKKKPEPIEVKTAPENMLVISQEQGKEVKFGPVTSIDFQEIRGAVGTIDFDKYHTTDVYSPYQGRINKFLVKAGEDVKKGQVLFTVLAPDIAQASATLLSTSGILQQANETLKRANVLYETKSISLKELEQNIADQQSAEANFIAAKKSMALFGFSNTEIESVIEHRKIDIELKVKSPMKGRVITRSAAPGQLVQPGNPPAPVTVSDINHLWMVAQVPESEAPFYKVGQSVKVKVQAYPDKEFPASILYVGDSVDPNTRRMTLYAQIPDEEHVLKPQMLASFQIEITQPAAYPAVPAQALVRESDGTRTVWVTNDGITFQRRAVKIGMTQSDRVQIVDGLKVGEVIAMNKALFLSNLYTLTH